MRTFRCAVRVGSILMLFVLLGGILSPVSRVRGQSYMGPFLWLKFDPSTPIDFGKIILPLGSGGNVTQPRSGTAVTPPTMRQIGVSQAGRVRVSVAQNSQFQFVNSWPSQITLTNTEGDTLQMSLDTGPSVTLAHTTPTDKNVFNFPLGGNVNIPASQASGIYTGELLAEVNFTNPNDRIVDNSNDPTADPNKKFINRAAWLSYQRTNLQSRVGIRLQLYQPISVRVKRGLSFGKLSLKVYGFAGTFKLRSNGTYSKRNDLTITSPPVPADIRVKGSPRMSYQLTLPTQTKLTSSNGDKLRVVFAPRYVSKRSYTQTLNAKGKGSVRIGGELKLGANPPLGTYSGQIQISVNYQ